MRAAIVLSGLFAVVMFALIARALVVGSFWQEGSVLFALAHGRVHALVIIRVVWSLVLPTLFWIRRWMNCPRSELDTPGLQLHITDPTKTP